MRKIYADRFLKVFKVNAMTLYPFLLISSKMENDILINHERIHFNQIRKEGFFKFYFKYSAEYLKGRLKGQSHDESYRNISFEKEAYDNEENLNYE